MKRWWVRAAFVAAVVALPAQLAVREVASEPYPGLYQPSFGGEVSAGDTYRTTEPRVTVEDADGSSTVVGVEEVLPPTQVLPSTVFRTAFLGSPASKEPQTAAWLRERLLTVDPGSDPQQVTIEWRDVDRWRDSPRIRVAGVVAAEAIDVRATP